MTGVLDLLGEDVRSTLERAAVPRWAEPMLATLTDEPFSDPDWIFERKLDGERCLAFRDGDGVRLRSRNRRDLNGTYPEIVGALAAASSDRFVVDGEVVAFDGNVTSFQRLQKRMQIDDARHARSSGVAVSYYVFDVLHVDGSSTGRLALRDRKKLVKALFEYRNPLRFTQHRNTEGEAFFREACAKGWEGIIAKDATAPYVHGRSKKWQKFKCVHRQELVVGGFTDPRGERIGFGALLVGYHDGDRLVYAGKVGTGYDDDTLRRLRNRMDAIERGTRPFDIGDPPSKGVHWIAPDLVVEVAFTEWTSGGKLRHPRYVGVRVDKDAIDVVREDTA